MLGASLGAKLDTLDLNGAEQALLHGHDLRAKAILALRRLHKMPRLVRGFFRDPRLAYLAA